MIKKLSNLSADEIRKYLKTQYVTIYEKLDMPYFRVKVNKNGAFPLKSSTNNAITDIDCICNSMYKDICDYVKDNILPKKDEVVDRFEEVTIGFFYLPVKKAKRIEYNTIPEKSFIISDVSSNAYIPSVEEIHRILDLNCYGQPIICTRTFQDDEIDTIIKYIEDKKDDLEVLKFMTKGYSTYTNYWSDYETFTGLEIEHIEGVVLYNGNYKVQLIVNDTTPNIDKLTTKIYRDTIFKNIADELDEQETLQKIKDNSKLPYIEKVCLLFNDYVGKTDILTRFHIEPEDLLPPHEGFFGEFDMSKITNDETQVICKLNKVYKNVLRLMLHTFSIPASNNKFKGLPPEVSKKLNNITIALQYKNFAQVASML